MIYKDESGALIKTVLKAEVNTTITDEKDAMVKDDQR